MKPPHRIVFMLVVIGSCLAPVLPAAAHCDTTGGPVVNAARAALEAGDPSPVLHWVRAEDETIIRRAFEQTMSVRALGTEARALADRYFFETVVRIHRAGEGAPYSGLTDTAPEPIIAATDRALERGSLAELEEQLVAAVRGELAARFAAARARRAFPPGDVAGGREFVAAYVSLTHWVEAVFTATHGTAHGAADHREALDHAAAPDSHGQAGHLPWLVAGLLAIIALVEAVLLVRRRHVDA